MTKKSNPEMAILALVFSVIALLMSGYAVTNGGGVSEDKFMAKVEEGINEYIEKNKANQGGAAAPSKPIDVSVDDDATLGDKDAPVTIVEFSDYECPFCAKFYSNTLPQLKSEYIDKGKVKLVYRDFPLSFHANAKPAAMAAECARDQGGDDTYFAFHDLIFQNIRSLNRANYEKWATEVGVDAKELGECLDSNKFSAEVEKDFAEGQSYGVSGTPAFFVNGKRVSGAQPFSVFQKLIDEELAK